MTSGSPSMTTRPATVQTVLKLTRRRRCQSNGRSSTRSATCPLASDDLRRKGAPLRQCGRASLLVNLSGDEMPLLIEMVVDLGVN